MKKEKSPIETIERDRDIFIPNVSVECAIFGFHSGCLKVLLCKLKAGNKWMLPGGFIAKNETPDDAASRILESKTKLKDVYLKQFYFFGKKEQDGPNDKEDSNKSYVNSNISLAYYALVKYEDVKVYANDEYEEAAWFDIGNIPEVYADHKVIFDTAISTIRKQIGFVPIGYELLPEKFTMPELRSIYESILDRELDRRNFQRKMLSIGFITSLNETRKVGAHKSPNLYSFDKEKYKEAEQLGIQIMSNNL
ncbi:NUDIX hydrolase [Dysgonomonas sp. 521]|uniref:NUDIX hydrolase n=1 Tax=Dysgonomonas sp. 521 TaxID=2302932 RepID=UPI0013D1A9B1|nr:NUDIX domain-containing protein [Dysgonomonas sp. 521]NDV95404.1 NUDIX hydrolase [Dysgonomonas sp. 521]